MNTIEDLNNYGNTAISFTDERARTVTFTNTTPANGNETIYSGESYYAYDGTNIKTIINPNNDVFYSITVSNTSIANVSWSTVPSGMTVTTVGTTKKIGPIQSVGQWNAVKAPQIVYPAGFAPNSFTYNSSIIWGDTGANTKNWTTNVSVLQGALSGVYFTTSTPMTYGAVVPPANMVDPAIANLTVNGQPTIVSQDTTTQYQLLIKADLDNTPGQFNFTSLAYGSPPLIVGTIAQLNANLANITISPAKSILWGGTPPLPTSNWTQEVDGTVQYQLYDSTGSTLLATRDQDFTPNARFHLSNSTITTSAFGDTAFKASLPTMLPGTFANASYNLTQTYSVYIPKGLVSNVTSSGTGNVTVAKSSYTHSRGEEDVWTFTMNPANNGVPPASNLSNAKANLNSYIGNITITPNVSNLRDFDMRIRAYSDYVCPQPDTEPAVFYPGWTSYALKRFAYKDNFANTANIKSSFYRNTPANLTTGNVLLSNVSTGKTYTVSLTAANAQFRQSAGNYVSTVSNSGSGEAINTWLNSLTLYPEPGFTGNAVLSYTQLVNGNLKINSRSVPFQVIANVSPYPEQTTYTFTPNNGSSVDSYTFTPSEYQSRYLKCNVRISANAGYGSGSFNNFYLPYDSYTIVFNTTENQMPATGNVYTLMYADNNASAGWNYNNGPWNRFTTSMTGIQQKMRYLINGSISANVNYTGPVFFLAQGQNTTISGTTVYPYGFGNYKNFGPPTNTDWYVPNLQVINGSGTEDTLNVSYLSGNNSASTGANVTIRFYGE